MKKKAFTLTELLVVVVIIGVLSAVVLPKFNKVIESRRTAEAESVMRAVRNEQEMRCTLDQNYTTNKDELAVWPKQDSANYTYALNEGGMSATRKDKDYTLEIKTYLDGGICCRGSYCSSLNKDYPLCDDYEATPNTKDCVPADVGEAWSPTPVPACEPTHNGQTVYETDCPSFQWGSQYYPQVGSVKYVWDADSCEYTAQSHCVCSAPKGSSYTENKCPAPQVGSYTYEWDANTCDYIEHNYCTYCKPANNQSTTYTEDCPSPQVGSITYRWDVNTCEYEVEEHCSVCSPTHNGQSSYTEECPEGQTGQITYTWNVTTCQYDKRSSCQDSCSSSRTSISANDAAWDWQNVDTCDGDATNRYICPLAGKKECIDVYASSGNSSSGGGCSVDCYGGAGCNECKNATDCFYRTGKNYPWKCVCFQGLYKCMVDTESGRITDSNGNILYNPMDDSGVSQAAMTREIFQDKVVCCPALRLDGYSNVTVPTVPTAASIQLH